MPSRKTHKPGQLLESFARCTQNGFVASNPDNKITHFSPIMEKLTGWHQSEVLGKDTNFVYSIPDMGPIDEHTGISTQAATVFTRDQKKITLATRRILIKDSHNADDGTLILFLTDSFIADRLQADFISTVSHELRTPITSIKGFASTLLHHKDNLDPNKTTKYLGIIKDQAERLSRLVEDLLAVSRLENRKIQLTILPLEIKAIVEKISAFVSLKYNGSHSINIAAPEKLPQVWADPDRLEQILTNLIDNAIKYSPKANKVDIEIYEDQKMLRIDVTDHGIGIDPKDIQKIFNKFSRLDSPLTRTTEGTGLGLFISHSLAKLLQGDLTVNSGNGQTTFSLVLPIESYDPDTGEKS